MVTFAEHPDQWTILKQRPELAVQAVDEVMRWFPSAGSVYRIAAENFEYRDVHVTEGMSFVVVVAVPANGPMAWRPPIGIHGPYRLPLCFDQ